MACIGTNLYLPKTVEEMGIYRQMHCNCAVEEAANYAVIRTVTRKLEM